MISMIFVLLLISAHGILSFSFIYYYRGKKKNLAQPDIPCYSSQGRYLIHMCIVRKELFEC